MANSDSKALKILLCSYVFSPSIGGIETVSSILADEFQRLGAGVTVVTDTPGPPVSAAYRLLRRPSQTELYRLARNADICFQNNISLHTIFPLLASRRPVIVTHQTWLQEAEGRGGWRAHLKLAILRACHNIAISRAIASALPMESLVIGNPFEPGEFADLGSNCRTQDVVFMGRLVSDKGCDLVLRALDVLQKGGIRVSFTVIGDGPEAPALKRLVAELGLSDQVSFRGVLGEGRGRVVAQHKILVIPSVWEEPFGVVALEGIAAGCAIAAANVGGLPEAVGPCGILFPKGDVAALAAALRSLLADCSLRQGLVRKGRSHLEQFRPEVVAGRYLEIFESTLGN